MNRSEEMVVDAARRDLSRAVILAFVLLAGLTLVFTSPLSRELRSLGLDALVERVRSIGYWAPLVFVLGSAAAISCGMPRVLFAALGGLAFGWWQGALLATAATIGGCLLTFGFARFLGRSWVQSRLGARLYAIDRFVESNGVATNLLLRCAPVGNCYLVNLLLGVSRIRLGAFVVGTLLGTMPETLIYSLYGSAAVGSPVLRITAGALLMVFLGVVYYLITKRSTLARELSLALKDEGSR